MFFFFLIFFSRLKPNIRIENQAVEAFYSTDFFLQCLSFSFGLMYCTVGLYCLWFDKEKNDYNRMIDKGRQ
jgi:hypothetical protein